MTVSKADIAEGNQHIVTIRQTLEHTVSKKEAQVLRIVVGKEFLLLRQMKHIVRKIAFAVVGDGIDRPFFRDRRFCDGFFTGLRIDGHGFDCACPVLQFSGVGIQFVLVLPEQVFHVRDRNGFKIFIL